MKFFWQNPTWRVAPKTGGMTRRAVIGGLIAMPFVAQSGVLMPVRKLIMPDAPKLLTQSVVVSLEASNDGVNWFPVVRAIGREDTVLRPDNFPLEGMPKPAHYRQILTPAWKPSDCTFAMPANEKLSRMYNAPTHTIAELQALHAEWQLPGGLHGRRPAIDPFHGKDIAYKGWEPIA